MANVLPDDSDIRFEKSKAVTSAHEQAHVSAASQAVVFAPQSLPAVPVDSPEAAPPAGKGPNKNKAPELQDDSAATAVNTEVDIDVLANDSDPDGDPLSVVAVGSAANGTVVINPDYTVTYTPDTDFEGTDTFTYSVDDGQGNIATATVEVTVGAPPPPPPPPPQEPVNYIEALTFDDINRWNYNDPLGTPVVLTYMFLEGTPNYYHPSSAEWRKFQAFNAEQQALTRDMLDMFETYTNITFVETSNLEDAQITYAYADIGARYAGWAYIPDGDDGIMDHSGDVWLNVKYGQDLTPGTYYGLAVLHETGHAVGLAHSFSGTVLNDPTQDHRGYTVMSYDADVDGGPEPVTLMLYDIAAVQYLYGANMSTNAGDTVYDLSDYYGINYAIWDAGGNDTFDGSSEIVDLVLDLSEGGFSSIGLTNSLSIAYGAVIENATGGAGDDVIAGNDAGNVIAGGAGSDVLFGGGGDDTLYYDGTDVLDGGTGTDTLVAFYDAIIDAGSALISGFEIFDLDDAFTDVVNVVLADILDLSDNDDLYISGDDGVDTVNVTGGTNNGAVDVNGVSYTHYSGDGADLFIESGLLINETGIV